MGLCIYDLSKECEGKFRDCTDCVLDKMRDEILLRDKNVKDVRTDGHCFFTANEILEIIDEYKGV